MPKRIDYADRVEAIREVAYEIAQQEGVDAINLPAVAERLCMSPRTIMRLIASERALPHLALQRAERLERNRLFQRSRYAEWASRPLSQRALATLLEQLPGHDDAADRQVWWQLVLAHATAEWARAARAEREAVIAALTADVMTDIAHEATRAHEASRLHFLLDGAIAQICLGRATYQEANEVVSRHVRDVLTALRTPDHDAA